MRNSQYGRVSRGGFESGWLSKCQRIQFDYCKLGVSKMLFTKAVDRMNHLLLIHKLSTFGISSNFIQLIQSYLSSRPENTISYNGFKSCKKHLNIWYSTRFYHHRLFYADDLKIFNSVKNEADCRNVLSDLRTLENWRLINKLYSPISQ